MSDSTENLTLQFLEWLSLRQRTYGEVMDAWRTSCPRLSIWEDAQRHGLIKIERDGAMRRAKVSLTPRGCAILKTPSVPSVSSMVSS